MRIGLLILITGLIPLPWGWLTCRSIEKLWRRTPARDNTDSDARRAASELWDYQI